jgi:uncharacterized protein (DUF2235 family)
MARKIILLSDGTGNSASKIWRTNVWRTFESLDLSNSNQVAFYDDGVGTSSFKPLAILGGAFGYGLKRNVLDLYKFVCRNYRSADDYARVPSDASSNTQNLEDDEIYGFGFSRGAFTIRVVVGLIADQGLVSYSTEQELDRKVVEAYRAYRAKHFHSTFGIENIGRLIRSIFVGASHDETERPVQSIRFLGLWDTVAAYGLPVDEWTRGISKWIWPLELPGRQLSSKVERACHAVCLDDERTTFQPVLWDESLQPDPASGTWPAESQRISQVWFAGVHSNVGGGYPDDSLAQVPLTWMMHEAEKAGLQFKKPPKADRDAVLVADSAADKDGRLYDSRSGLGGYYRYGPRRVDDLCSMKLSGNPEDKVEISLPKIHESVFGRIKTGAHLYAPIGLPRDYAVVAADGSVKRRETGVSETGDQRNGRCTAQEKVWNTVWKRRVIYFLTVFASLHLILYPLYRVTFPSDELESPLRLVSDAIRLLSAFLPSGASRWIDAYARDPGWFLISAGWVAVMIGYGTNLGGIISDRMRRAWNEVYPVKPLNGNIAASAGYRGGFHQVLWFCFVLFLCYVLFHPVFESHLPEWALPKKYNQLTFLKYSAQPVRLIIAAYLFVHFIPDRCVQWLREWRLYKWLITTTKLKIAPAIFAAATVWFGFGFASHYIFDIRDAFGVFCLDSPAPHVLDVCPENGPATSSCSRQIDVDFTSQAGLPKPTELCQPTDILLERGNSYLVSVRRQDSTVNWQFWDERAHTYGQSIVELPKMKRAIMFALFPLRRSFDRPWVSIIARFGSTGNEENFMDPDPVRLPSEALGEVMTPKKDGQLFFYLNQPVLGIWGFETLVSDLIGNDGKAHITVKRTK